MIPGIAVLLTSSSEKVFSAGLDLKAAVENDTTDKIVAYTEVISTSLISPMYVAKPVACVVSGAAIAGGMVLACACDFVAIDSSKSFVVGVTEVAVGVPFPRRAYEAVVQHIGTGRNLRDWIYRGKTYPASEGFAKGFGDVYSPTPRQAALDWISEMLAFNPGIFAITKRQINSPYFVSIQHTDKQLSLHTKISDQDRTNAAVMSQGLSGGVPPPAPATAAVTKSKL